MSCYIGKNKIKLFIGSSKVKKGYVGAVKVYSAGNVVTYHVDTNVTYSEEVDSDATCLSPSTFTPAKAGWQFIGWREDTIASGNVLSKKVMGDAPVNLYAVFQQAVSLSLYNNSASASVQNLTRYYNNGTVSNPTYKANQAARSGWTARGWSTSTAGNAAITYANGATVTVSANTKLYGCYQAGVTLSLYNNSATPASYSLTRYYNSSGAVVNPTKVITQAGKSGWTARGFSTSNAAGAGITYANGVTVTVSANMTLYGYYQAVYTLTYNGNGATGGSTGAQSGTAYYNSSGLTSYPKVTVQGCGFNRANYLFTNWVCNNEGYTPGQGITLSGNWTMTAQWIYSVVGNFGYSGTVQPFTIPYTGNYLLEVWGGGTNPSGSAGGYSRGEKSFNAGTVVYVCIGGQGTLSGENSAAGYNGGGRATHNRSWDEDVGYHTETYGGGGGATHIALAPGTLQEVSSNSVLIVAGGAGGGLFVDESHLDSSPGEYRITGNAGGGLTGSGEYPGTQTQSGHYPLNNGPDPTAGKGKGADSFQGPWLDGACAGGGGWFGGGRYSGGSGYIGGVENASSVTGGGTNGNGSAKITLLRYMG